MFLGHSVMLSSVAELADLVTLVIKFKYQKNPKHLHTSLSTFNSISHHFLSSHLCPICSGSILKHRLKNKK